MIATSSNFVLVNPSLPVHSIAELIALARSQPGKVDFASTGTGTSTHLAALLFASMANVQLNAIPYKGVAPAVTDLLGGQVALMFCPMASVVGQVRAGKFAGYRGDGRETLGRCFRNCRLSPRPVFPVMRLNCTMVWSRRPVRRPMLIAKLNAALNNALADSDIGQRFAADGTETLPGTPQAYAADIASEEAKWGAIIKKAGVKAE